MHRTLASLFLCTVALTLSAVTTGAQEDSSVKDILVSRQLAESEQLAVGDIVKLATKPDGTGARRFRISGIYEPTPDPQRLGAVPREVRLHLPDLFAFTRDASQAAGTESADISRRLVTWTCRGLR